jgi:hypothetical protein
MCPDGLNGSPHGRAGGKPIVNENDKPVAQFSQRTAAPVLSLAAVQFGQFLTRDRFDRACRDSVPPNDLVIQHTHTARCDGAHCELRVSRHSQLPDDEDVEGRAKRFGDFERHRNTAARQREDHDVGPAAILVEFRTQFRARFTSIRKRPIGLREHRDPVIGERVVAARDGENTKVPAASAARTSGRGTAGEIVGL